MLIFFESYKSYYITITVMCLFHNTSLSAVNFVGTICLSDNCMFSTALLLLFEKKTSFGILHMFVRPFFFRLTPLFSFHFGTSTWVLSFSLCLAINLHNANDMFLFSVVPEWMFRNTLCSRKFWPNENHFESACLMLKMLWQRKSLPMVPMGQRMKL